MTDRVLQATDPSKSSIYRGISWAIAGTAGQIASRVIGIGILARYIGPVETGLWATITLIYTPLVNLVAKGVSPTLIRQRHLPTRHLQRTLGLLILLGLSLFAATLAGSFAFGSYLPAHYHPAWILLGGLIAVLQIVHVVLKAKLARELRFREITLVRFGGILLGFWLTTVPLAILGYGVWSLALGMLITCLVVTCVSWLTTSISPRFDVRPLVRFLRESASFSLAGTLNSWALTFDNYVVWAFLGPQQLGVYTKSYALTALPTRFIAQSSESVLLPTLSRRQDSRERLAKNMIELIQVYILTTAPISIFILLYSEEIVSIYLGKKWLSVGPTLSALALTLVMRPISRPATTILKSRGRVRRLVQIQLAYVLTLGIFTILLVPLGITGVAWGVNTGTCTLAILSIAAGARELLIDIKDIAVSLLPIIIANAVLLCLLFCLHELCNHQGIKKSSTLAIGFGCAGVAYCAMLLVKQESLLPQTLRGLIAGQLPARLLPFWSTDPKIRKKNRD